MSGMASSPTATVRLGSDVLLGSRRLHGSRVGVVCNHASVDVGFDHIIDRLAKAPGVHLAAIFGPQHGFRSDVQDNMIETPHGDDATRRVPVYSLYSDTREPTAEMLRDLDVLVIDLQDIGARIYTYIYTMANCLRAAARYRIPVIVCDRPNPIGGVHVEGASLSPRVRVVRRPVSNPDASRHDHRRVGRAVQRPFRHRRLARDRADGALAPRTVRGRDRTALGDALTEHAHARRRDRVSGTVLFEGTLLSEGRGTTRPFELVGAPWIDADAFAAAMNALELPGVYFRPAVFVPTFQKHGGESCGGCQIHVLDRHDFRPVLTGVALIEMFHRFDPAKFAWRPPPYEYENHKPPIDILAGSDALRRQVEGGVPLPAIAASWLEDEEAFARLREPHLLY